MVQRDANPAVPAHFLSWVVIGATAYQMFTTGTGIINVLITNAGGSGIPSCNRTAGGCSLM